ncbi:unnamed protein product [Rotaria sp. Silwood2]|nr:unnamed protein product [Rotaria sp. Silwood2]CAF4335572.1 unnamed protein product [Rotaria sp. Silwood2]
MENTCFLAIHSRPGFVWSTIVIYVLPMIIISIIYIKLTRFMQRPSITTSVHAKRDLVVVRRIVLVVGLLMLIGAPSVVLKLMLPFTNVGKPLFYRIQNMIIVTAMIALSLMVVYVTPQVKEILVRIRKRTKVKLVCMQQQCVLADKTIKS